MNAFLDMLERVFWTFVQTFIGVLIASPVFDNLGVGYQDALKIGLFAGLAAVAKVVLAYALSKSSGGSSLPASTVEVQPDTHA